MTAADLEAFRVKFNGHCLFLDYKSELAQEKMARLADRHERQVKLEAVLGEETAARIIDIIEGQDEDKQDAFLETFIEKMKEGKQNNESGHERL